MPAEFSAAPNRPACQQRPVRPASPHRSAVYTARWCNNARVNNARRWGALWWGAAVERRCVVRVTCIAADHTRPVRDVTA